MLGRHVQLLANHPGHRSLLALHNVYIILYITKALYVHASGRVGSEKPRPTAEPGADVINPEAQASKAYFLSGSNWSDRPLVQ